VIQLQTKQVYSATASIYQNTNLSKTCSVLDHKLWNLSINKLVNLEFALCPVHLSLGAIV